MQLAIEKGTGGIFRRREGMTLTRVLVCLLAVLAVANILLMLLASRAGASVASPQDAWRAVSNSACRVASELDELLLLQNFERELVGWRQTRLPCGVVLAEAKKQLPPSVKISMFSMRESKGVMTIQPEHRQRPVVAPYREFRCQIEGRAGGGGRLNEVADYASRLSAGEALKNFFGSVKLQGVIPEPQAPGEEPTDVFSIVAESRPRPWK
jgi:hypothetical protein